MKSLTAAFLVVSMFGGMAFGAALGGTVANGAGLQEVTTPEAVRTACS